MISGILLFAAVAHFLLKPKLAASAALPPMVVYALLGVALAACVLSLVLRGRIPRRPSNDSADLFWTGAAGPAMRMWAALEGASLLSVFLYARTGTAATVAVATIAVVLFILLNPGVIERR